MGERFSDREARIGAKRGLEERLKEYPELRKKFEMLLEVVENAAGDVEKAAEAERRVTEELREMGNAVLNAWGRQQAGRKENETAKVPGMQRKLKKNVYWHTRYGRIEVEEQIFRRGSRGPEVRPFSQTAEVECRGCSEPLERAIVDFGADAAGTKIPEKLKEHYGIEVAASTCWQVVLRHAEAMGAMPKKAPQIPDRAGVEQLIAETDGSFIPIVETAEPVEDGPPVDRRKTRKLCWKEARLTLVHPKGSVTPVFSATMGTPEQVGDDMLRAAIRVGLGSKTKVHCVGDGAPWIADQVVTGIVIGFPGKLHETQSHF